MIFMRKRQLLGAVPVASAKVLSDAWLAMLMSGLIDRYRLDPSFALIWVALANDCQNYW